MKYLSLKNILLTHLQNTEGWTSKGNMYVVAENAGYSPESGARILRSLAEDGIILVSYFKGKRSQKLARYARLGEKPLPPKAQVKIIIKEGKPIAVMA